MGLPAGDFFLNGAVKRIRRAMVALAVIAIPVLLVLFDWKLAGGFALGAILSFYNFRSLEQGSNAIADSITVQGDKVPASRVVSHFLVRYVVIAAVAYGIFSVSLTAFYGFVGGLFLPIAGVGCEAAYEMYVALRRGF